MRFKAKYEVGDGYVCGSSPYYFYIDQSSIDDEMDEETLMGVFFEIMQDDFETRICPIESCKEEYLDWCKSAVKKLNSD